MGSSARRRLESLTQHVKISACAATEAAREVTLQQSTAPHPGRILTDEEKRSLYHNGYVIIRDVVKKDVVQRIHDEIENSPANANGRHPAYVRPSECPPVAVSALPADLTRADRACFLAS